MGKKINNLFKKQGFTSEILNSKFGILNGKGKRGFTLVELIIVIAIIAVLAVAAFMMLTKWLGKSRDSRRILDLGTIARGLQVGYSDIDDGINMYPTIKNQDGVIALLSGTEEVGYQGKVDIEVVKGASMQKVPLDPSDQNEYTYLVTQNRQKFQVLGMLEDGIEVSAFNNVFALEYKNRIPVTKGFELGVLLQKNTNLPIQYAGESFTGIDLMAGDERNDYKAIVSDKIIRTGTGVALSPIVNEEIIVVDSGTEQEEIIIKGDDTNGRTWSDGTYAENCFDYLNPGTGYIGSSSSGYYLIKPESLDTPLKVYCDMVTDGGGWTAILVINPSIHQSVYREYNPGYTEFVDSVYYYNHMTLSNLIDEEEVYITKSFDSNGNGWTDGSYYHFEKDGEDLYARRGLLKDQKIYSNWTGISYAITNWLNIGTSSSAITRTGIGTYVRVGHTNATGTNDDFPFYVAGSAPNDDLFSDNGWGGRSYADDVDAYLLIR